MTKERGTESTMKEKEDGRLLWETIRFAVTGGVCFLVELAVYTLLTKLFHTDTLLATAVAFCISVLLNWLLCMKWVFPEAGKQNVAAKAAFLITSLIGLLLNELLMFLFRIVLGETRVLIEIGSFRVTMDLLNKCLATLLVTIWNFFTKRAVLTSGLVSHMTERFRK